MYIYYYIIGAYSSNIIYYSVFLIVAQRPTQRPKAKAQSQQRLTKSVIFPAAAKSAQ